MDSGHQVTAIAIYSIGLMAIVVSVRATMELILMSYPLLAFLVLIRFVENKSGDNFRTNRLSNSA